MKPIFSTQIIVRAALWAFVFMAELLIMYAIKKWHGTYGHDAIYIATAIAVFLATFRFGGGGLIADFRDLCFYDIIVQCIGWYSYKSGYSMDLYVALNYTVLILKFVRLSWPIQTINGVGLESWPVFGPFSYLMHRQGIHAHQTSPKKFSKQDYVVYVAIFGTFAFHYIVEDLGFKLTIEFWAAIGLAIFLIYFVPFQIFLDKRETEYHANREKAAALAATQAQNAALESKNAELAQLNAQLEQAVREKDDALQLVETVFKTLATAAHDLRAPLTTINVRADAFERASDSERPKAKLALHSAVKYVCDGLDQAIHQAKLTNKLALPRIRAVYLPQLMYTLYADWSEFAFEKDLAGFQIYPKYGSDFMVASDTWVLQRILRNLVVNAIEHSRDGEAIGLSMRQKGGRCLVRVWNTGAVIADANGPDREANFARFVARVRANGHRSTASGHGLGLESVAQLCEVLGIKMGLYSRPRRGTVFGFALDMASAELIADTERLAKEEQTQVRAALDHLGFAQDTTPLSGDLAMPVLPYGA